MTEYAGINSGHLLGAVDDSGRRLSLDDGSVWLVYEGFAFRSSAWETGEMIRIKASKSPEYPYLVINIHRNESVEAALHTE